MHRDIVSEERRSAGDPIPATCELIEVRVAELQQLFNAMDPSPFHDGTSIPTPRTSS
jgi:hypothetical protein